MPIETSRIGNRKAEAVVTAPTLAKAAAKMIAVRAAPEKPLERDARVRG